MKQVRRRIGNIFFWIIYPGVYILLSNSHRARVIIYVDDEVLFVTNWLSDNKLTLPGGGIQSGEKSKAAAIREVFEETGIELKESQLVETALNIQVNETGIKYFVDLYSVRLPRKIISDSKNIEILETTWAKFGRNTNANRLSKTTNMLLLTWLDTPDLVN